MFFEDFGRFQTGCEKLKNAIADARRMAPNLKPILITGERGTGRTEMALEIIEKSSRAQSTLKILRPGEEIPIELDFGTVLIEDIQDFKPLYQEVILKRIALTIGGIRGPRWIATATSDLLARVRKTHFSVSLYQVLNEQTVTLPSLEERRGDVALLVECHIEMLGNLCGTSKKLSAACGEKLSHMSFRRNFTDLFEQVEAAHLKSVGPFMSLADFGFAETEVDMQGNMAQRGLTISEMERKLILQTLQITDQNRTRAAELLGISIRTLRNKLNEYREEGTL